MTRKRKILLLILAACIVIFATLAITSSISQEAEKQKSNNQVKERVESITPFYEQIENAKPGE